MMSCPECHADIAGPPVGQDRPLRCLECGTLFRPPVPQRDGETSARPIKHVYRTPYGGLVGKVRESGEWVLISQIVAHQDDPRKSVALVKNLITSLAHLRVESLARLHSFDQEKLRVQWVLHAVPSLEPLSRLRPPLTPDEVERLIRSLAPDLDRLHREGLGCYDLDPSTVFVRPGLDAAFLVPTPWLASQARRAPGSVVGLPFVAPELGDAAAHPDPARADVYALGALSWFLLTGTIRKENATRLPSEHRPDLSRWDAFVDGCCRTRPDRRFGTALAAVEALGPSHRAPELGPTPAPSKAFVTSTPGQRRLQPRTLLIAILILLAVGIVAASLRRDRLADLLPGGGGLLSRHQRGFADTILRYEDRSYDGASWKKVQDAEALRVAGNDLLELTGVAGWDSRNYWIVGTRPDSTAVLRYRDGHWSTATRIDRYGADSVLRVLDSDTLLLAVGVHSGLGGAGLYRIDATGLVDYGKVHLNPQQGGAEICPIAPDLFYFYGSDEELVVKVADGKREDLKVDRDKEASVHREDNVPLKEYPVFGVRLTRTPEAGRAIGLAPSREFGELKLVEFRDGIWYVVSGFGERGLIDIWLGTDGAGRQFVVGAGRDGYIRRQVFDAPASEQIVPKGDDEATSSHLLKVWGVSPTKYRAMDSHGTVWEWSSERWRQVVRGLDHDKIKFRHAWVSPEGVVVAITENAVYRLE